MSDEQKMILKFEEFYTTKYTFSDGTWLEIYPANNNGYLVDSNKFAEEIYFSESDDLLDFLRKCGLIQGNCQEIIDDDL